MKRMFCSCFFFLSLWLLTLAIPTGNDASTISQIRYAKKVYRAAREPRVREKRSIMQLNDMVKDVIGRSGMDFVSYGNWCGPGGGGQPVDPIDTCCAIHDFCYNKLVDHNVCPNGENGILYGTNYEWQVQEGSGGKKLAECGENSDSCKKLTCHCDTQIVNCFQENMDSYRDENLHSLSFNKLLNMVFTNGR